MRNLGIITRCNQKCVFCRTQKFLETGLFRESSLQTLKSRIEEAVAHGESILFSGGGEPTRLANLPALVKYAKDLGATTTVLETNAVKLHDPAYTQALEEAGLDECVVSLHSHKKEISEQITQAPETFNLTIQGMKNLSRSKIKFTVILHVVNTLNFKDIKPFMSFIETEFPNIRKINLCVMRPSKEMPQTIGMTPQFSEMIPYLKDALDLSLNSRLGIEVESQSIPLCLAKGFEERLSHVRVIQEGNIKEMENLRLRWEAVFADVCESCSCRSMCMGLRKEYLDTYGSEELQPYHEKLADVIDAINQRVRKDSSLGRFWAVKDKSPST